MNTSSILPTPGEENRTFILERNWRRLNNEQKWRLISALRYQPRSASEVQQLAFIFKYPEFVSFSAPPYELSPVEKANHCLYYGWFRADIYDFQFGDSEPVIRFPDMSDFPPPSLSTPPASPPPVILLERPGAPPPTPTPTPPKTKKKFKGKVIYRNYLPRI